MMDLIVLENDSNAVIKSVSRYQVLDVCGLLFDILIEICCLQMGFYPFPLHKKGIS